MSNLPNGWLKTTLGEVISLSQGLAINVKTKHLLTKNKTIGLPLLKINNLLNNSTSDYVNKMKCPQQCIVKNGGRAQSYTEEQGKKVMSEEEITITVDMKNGNTSARIWTSDLSYDYVKFFE